MQKTPVYKGSRVFPACAKGRRRFTSLSQNRCETFVKRQKREKGLESPVDRGVWKWKRFFENTHARYTHARTLFCCRHWALLLIQPRDSCSRAWDSCSHQKVVPLLEKPYRFWKSPTIFPPLQLSHHWEQLYQLYISKKTSHSPEAFIYRGSRVGNPFRGSPRIPHTFPLSNNKRTRMARTFVPSWLGKKH